VKRYHTSGTKVVKVRQPNYVANEHEHYFSVRVRMCVCVKN